MPGSISAIQILIGAPFEQRFGNEWLPQYYWPNLDEVQFFAAKWMYNYNHDRPNVALGGITPNQRLAMAA